MKKREGRKTIISGVLKLWPKEDILQLMHGEKPNFVFKNRQKQKSHQICMKKPKGRKAIASGVL